MVHAKWRSSLTGTPYRVAAISGTQNVVYEGLFSLEGTRYGLAGRRVIFVKSLP
jgi:hypothetical protein